MFRVSQVVREALDPTPLGPARRPAAPVVIWNLSRTCNLACKHCYAISSDRRFPDELTKEQMFAVIDDLAGMRVPMLILSGGEPLMHPEVFSLTHQAKARGMRVALSTNGTLINDGNIAAIRLMGYDYVGISLDGYGETHDRFRRKAGAFEAALNGLRLCRDAGIRVGIRFTLTEDNAQDLARLLALMEAERIPKFYLSHLNYAGRGKVNRRDDAYFVTTRRALDLLFETAMRHAEAGLPYEFVTGNNDADGVYFLQWMARRDSASEPHLRAKLAQWGGNATGIDIANIDNEGRVHPDSMWWEVTLGNVKVRPFSAIWREPDNALMDGLRRRPRPLEGRCAGCGYLDVCGGNTRVRAWQTSGNPWAEDPGCYLEDAEIGLAPTLA